jgi:hypothetical protein
MTRVVIHHISSYLENPHNYGVKLKEVGHEEERMLTYYQTQYILLEGDEVDALEAFMQRVGSGNIEKEATKLYKALLN